MQSNRPVATPEDLMEVAEASWAQAVNCAASVKVCKAFIAATESGGLRDFGKGWLAQKLMFDALIFKLAIYTTRCFARVVKDDRHLAAGMEYVRKQVQQGFPDYPGHTSKFAASLTRLLSDFDRVSADQRIRDLKRTRDKMLAHFAPGPTVPNPMNVSVIEAAELTIPLLDGLIRALGEVRTPLDKAAEPHAHSAQVLWMKAP